MSGATRLSSGLRLADEREAAGLAAFLARLLRYDRAAVVRLQTAGRALAVFGRVPLGDPAPLAIRPTRLAVTEPLDLTLSAGQLLDALDPVLAAPAADARSARPVGAPGHVRAAGRPGAAGSDDERSDHERPERERSDLSRSDHEAGLDREGPFGEDGWPDGGLSEVRLPSGVTGPPWAGLLPPRGGWEPVGELPADAVAVAVAAGVSEFRARSAEPGADAEAVAERIWARPLGPVGGLPLRAAHAAQVLGFLVGAERLRVHRHSVWLRLSTPGGSVVVRRVAAPGTGLGLTPIR